MWHYIIIDSSRYLFIRHIHCILHSGILQRLYFQLLYQDFCISYPTQVHGSSVTIYFPFGASHQNTIAASSWAATLTMTIAMSD